MKKTISFLLCLVLLLSPLFCADALAECSVADITTDDPDGETVTVTVNDPDPVIWVRASGKDRKIEESTVSVGTAQIQVQDFDILIEGDLSVWRDHPSMKGVPAGVSHDQPALVIMAIQEDSRVKLNGSTFGTGDTRSDGVSIWIDPGRSAELSVSGDIRCGDPEAVKYGATGLQVVLDDQNSRSKETGAVDIHVSGSIRAVTGEEESSMCTAIEAVGGIRVPLEGAIRVEGEVLAEGGGYSVHGIELYSNVSVLVETGPVTARSSAAPATAITCSDGQNTMLSVAGDVTAEGRGAWGVRASGGAAVTVDGDVYATSSAPEEFIAAVAIEAVDSEVVVNGNISARNVRRNGTGIEMYGSSQVIVNGDVTAADAVNVFLVTTQTEPGAGGIVVIRGSLHGSHPWDILVNCYTYDIESGEFLPLSLEESKRHLPTLVLREIDPEEGLQVWSDYSPVDEKIIQRTILSRARYILTYDDLTAPYWLTVEGTEEFEGCTVAREETVLTVRNARPGRELISLEAGKYAEVTKNEDGSFTVTVKRGGDMHLTAVWKEYTTRR